MKCTNCNTTGLQDDYHLCPVCNGTGIVNYVDGMLIKNNEIYMQDENPEGIVEETPVDETSDSPSVEAPVEVVEETPVEETPAVEVVAEAVVAE